MLRLAMGMGLPSVAAMAPQPSGAVVLNAVRMHLDYSLKYVAGTITSTRQGFMSVWLRGSGGAGSVGNTNLNSKYVFGGHKTGVADAEHEPGFNFTLDGNGWRLNFGDSTPLAMNGSYGPLTSAVDNAAWDHFFLVWNTNFANGSKRLAFFKNGVNTTSTLGSDATGGAADVALHDVDFWLNLVVSGYQTPSIFDISQFIFDNSDTSAWLTGNGTTAAGVIDKFYDGVNHAPVADTATGTNFTPGGTQPLIYHTGPATTFGTNRGSLSAPTVAGVAARAFPYDYMFGPGATPDRPYESWTAFTNNGGSFTNGGAFPVVNCKNPIALGDTILVFFSLGNNGTSNHASRNILLTGTGWTKVTDTWIDSTFGGDFAIWQKTAAAGDVTAANADWTNAPVVSWTNGAALATLSYTVSVWKGVSTIASAISGTSGVTGTLASGYPTPGATTAAGKGVLITGLNNFGWSNEGFGTAPPGENLLFWPNSAGMATTLAWEATNSAATTTKTWTATATGNPSTAFQLALS